MAQLILSMILRRNRRRIPTANNDDLPLLDCLNTRIQHRLCRARKLVKLKHTGRAIPQDRLRLPDRRLE